MASGVGGKISEDVLEKILSSAEPELAREFLRVIERIRDGETLQRLSDLISSGQMAEAYRFIERESQSFALAWVDAMLVAGVVVAAQIDRALPDRFFFDKTRGFVTEAARRHSRQVASGFAREQVDIARRGLIVAGTRDDARAAAKRIRETFGLSPRDQAAVETFRRLLSSGDDGRPDRAALARALRDKRSNRAIVNAIRGGAALSDDQIDKIVSRYAERLLRHRAEVIGRAEALAARGVAHFLALQQAMDDGDIFAEQIFHTWKSRADRKVRHSHKRLHGVRLRHGERFQGLHGLLRFPGDPTAPLAEVAGCRCGLETEILSIEEAFA